MNLHEYQAKQLLAQYGVNVPSGKPCKTVEEARAAADEIFGAGHGKAVIKSQIHAGGRGKGTFKHGFQGGVKLVDSAEEAESIAKEMLGNVLVTKQTGEEGRQVNTILVASAEKIVKEYYLAVLLDRESSLPIVIASTEGGMDIEEVAASTPDRIRKLSVDPRYGLLPHQAFWLANFLYDDPALIKQASKVVAQLYEAFVNSGASMTEINPLITTPDGAVKAIDAKMTIDGNELFRRPEVAEMRDLSAEPKSETKAREAGLSYVKLDGNVGCCVNGAGLAMATMDLVKYYGGEPANFLDIGGSSNPDKVVSALEIITSDPNVKVILFNIFGGITRCDDVANGIVEATKRIDIKPPIVIRLTGTNEELGVQILEEAGFSAYTSMDDVVEQAVELAKG